MKRTSNQYIAKYKAFSPIKLKDRNWPDAVIKKAPIWCSVDLRDGNQALIEPMGEEKKLRMFNLLLNIGFKEIEVGFPAASQTDFDFIRKIIRENLIPDDVKIQVLTQSRKELIDRTFESLKGAKSAILHLYNSTSTVQRKVVFKSNKKGIKKIAEAGGKTAKKFANGEVSFKASVKRAESGGKTDSSFKKLNTFRDWIHRIDTKKELLGLDKKDPLRGKCAYELKKILPRIEMLYKNLDK